MSCSSLWARFVTGTMANHRQVFRERKAHIIQHPVGIDDLQRRLWTEAEETQAMGARSTKKAKES